MRGDPPARSLPGPAARITGALRDALGGWAWETSNQARGSKQANAEDKLNWVLHSRFF